MEAIEIGGHPVPVARRFADRTRGLIGRSGGLLLPGRSVHGFGMRRRVWAVGLGRDGVVRAVAPLDPCRVVTFPRPVAWVLELPVTRDPPVVGEAVVTAGALAGR